MAVTLNNFLCWAPWLTAFVVAAGAWAALDNLLSIPARRSEMLQAAIHRPASCWHNGTAEYLHAVDGVLKPLLCTLTAATQHYGVDCAADLFDWSYAACMMPALQAVIISYQLIELSRPTNARSEPHASETDTYFLHCQPSSLAALCFPGFVTCSPCIQAGLSLVMVARG